MKTVVLFVWASLMAASLWAQQPVAEAPLLDGAETTRLVKAMADSVEAGYVFPEKGTAMKVFLLERLRKKAYEKVTLPQLAERLRTDLLSVCADKHIAVRPFRGEPGTRQPRPFENNLQPFRELKILDGNVGYLRFDWFPEGEEAMNGAMGGMLMLSGADALLIDMRYNGGGGMMLIQLISAMLLKEPTHLNSVYFRPQNTTFSSYTATVPDMQYQVLFKNPEGNGTDTATAIPSFEKLKRIPVYILTSDYTFSAAEEFTYNLQSLKRASVVGDTTGGGAHPVRGVPVLDRLLLVLPFARSVNPVTGTNWEGTGIRPDYPVDSEKALAFAHLHALRDMMDKKPNNAALTWQLSQVEQTYTPYVATEEELKTYVGTYEDRSIRWQDGKLVSQRTGQRLFTLTPMGPGLFGLDARMRLRFVKINGTVQKVEMLTQEGVMSQQMRSGG